MVVCFIRWNVVSNTSTHMPCLVLPCLHVFIMLRAEVLTFCLCWAMNSCILARKPTGPVCRWWSDFFVKLCCAKCLSLSLCLSLCLCVCVYKYLYMCAVHCVCVCVWIYIHCFYCLSKFFQLGWFVFDLVYSAINLYHLSEFHSGVFVSCSAIIFIYLFMWKKASNVSIAFVGEDINWKQKKDVLVCHP